MQPHTIDELERLNALETQFTRDLTLDLSPAGRYHIEQLLAQTKDALHEIWREIHDSTLGC